MNFNKLTDYLDRLGEDYGVPGYDLIVRKDHETVYRRMGGFSDYEGKRPVSDRDLYFLYSATKVITMTAAMQLIEEGRIGLEDPVSAYLPEFERMEVADHFVLNQWPPQIPTLADPHHPAGTPITIRMLMTMTAGLNYDIGNAEIVKLREKTGGRATTRQMMAAIAKMPLLFEPGTRYRYSLGHDVIAAVIEAISGERFSDYLNNHIFAPLGINDLTCHMTEEQRERLSALYRFDPETKGMVFVGEAPRYAITPNYESGGAALAGTTEAYAAVVEALANGGVGRSGARTLKEESVMRFTHPVITGEALNDFRVGRFLEYAYGLGVRVKSDPLLGYSPVGEFGWDGAAGGYAVVDPFNHVGIFYVEHVLNFFEGYSVIHPRVRDLVYKGLAR